MRGDFGPGDSRVNGTPVIVTIIIQELEEERQTRWTTMDGGI
jgi:hypothetical protein